MTRPDLFDAIPPEVVTIAAKPPAPEPSADPQPAPAEPTTTAAPPKSKPASASGPGFVPLVAGGLLAGVIGFVVANLTAPATDDTIAVTLAQQSATIAALQDQLANLPTDDGADLAELLSRFDALSAETAALSERLNALESRPVVMADDNGEASAAVAADMDALRAQLAEMADAAQTELDEARAAAAAIEENAAAAAREAASRAALARVQTALESGAPIGAALGDLEAALGASVPQELIAVQDGAPTLVSLQASFPDAARAALATARREGVAGEETTGFGAFIRNQFDVRSTAPREGDGADAVLSRAEASLKSGRLSDTLAELSALPEIARTDLSDWLALAEARAAAINAVDILSTSLSGN